MKRILPLSFLVFLMINNVTLFSQTVNKYAQDGKLIFQYKINHDEIPKSFDKNQIDFKSIQYLQELANDFGIISVYFLHPEIRDEKLSKTIEIQFDSIYKIDNLIKLLESMDFIEYAESKELHYKFLTPNDQYYSQQYQWNLFKINAAAAWDISTGLSSIVVAVTDDAIYTSHPDLTNKLVPGRDVAENTNNPNPAGQADGFHGTHVSGIVGAQTNNSIGIASIGFNVSVMPIKIARNSDGALVAGYDGIIWAADNGADIINMSWGGGNAGTYGQNVCNYAWNKGSILVAAAGNDGESTQFFPAAYNNVIAVASTASNDAKSTFSQYGTWINISAPGTNIVSLNQNGTYSQASGTSMASPLVAGLLGLMKSANPSMSNNDLISCLYSSADNIDAQNPNYINQLGAGRINAYQALLCVTATAAEYDAGIESIIQPAGSSCSNIISPIVELKNYGSENLNSVIIKYQITGNQLNSYEWTGNLSQGNSELVELPEMISPDGQQQFRVYTEMPNGNEDENIFNDEKTIHYGIFTSGLPIPWSEDFESGSFNSNLWSIENPDNSASWGIYNIQGTEPGNKSAGINFFSYAATGQRDGLITPPFNFAGFETIELSFEHAYRRKNTSVSDSLIILVSTDCGITFQRVFSIGENGTGTFATATTSTANFVPTQASDWCIAGTVGASCFTIDLTTFAGMDNIRIKFESYNNNGNNLYIDNINISGQAVAYDIGIINIINPVNTVCSGLVFPKVRLYNFGSEQIYTANIHYKLNDLDESIFEWSGSLNQDEFVIVELPGIEPISGSNNFYAYTTLPNGMTDMNTMNDASESQFIVIDHGIQLPFIEDFESGSFETNNWTILDDDMSTTWDIYNVQGTSPGNKAAGINFFFYENIGERDALITPPLNFYGHSEIELNFEHAYRRFNQASSDSLIVYISTDCAQTFERIFAAGENGSGSFATVVTSTQNFIPAQASDWCHSGTVGSACFTIDLSAYAGNPLVYVKFETYNNNGNNLFLDNINIISIGATAPIADFTADITETCINSQISFTDNSEGEIDTWLWDFGDGNISNLQNPIHIYEQQGIYSIQLTVSNSIGNNSITYDNYITVYPLPEVDLSYYSESCGLLEINVSDDYIYYEWNGIEGTNTYFVEESGILSVLIQDENGCITFSETDITIFPAIEVEVNITHESGLGEEDGEISLIIIGGSFPFSVLWSNGSDTETISGLAGGTYSFTVTDFNNCEYTGTVIVNIIGIAPIAQFTSDITSSCNSALVQFTDLSENNPDEWLWNFGDGNFSNEQNPEHFYSSPGVFTVSLRVFNDGGTTEIIKTDYIKIGQNPEFTVNTTPASGADIPDGEAWLEIEAGIPPYTIYWSTGEMIDYVSGLLPGLYSVVVKDFYNCMTTRAFEIDWVSSINEIANEISIYPNPASEYVIIKTGNLLLKTITVIDINGKIIIEEMTDYDNITLDLRNISNGLYAIIIKVGNTSSTYKISIVK